MRKKQLLMALWGVLAAFPVFAQDFSYQGVNYTVLDAEAKTVETKQGDADGNSGNPDATGALVIPATVSDGTSEYTVVTIGYRSFRVNKNITSIELPATVKQIGDGAFTNCTNVVSVKLSEGLESIGTSGLYGLSITSIEIPQSVKTLGAQALRNNKLLTEITFAGGGNREGVSIGTYCFMTCTALTSITLPECTLDSYAFDGCTALQKVTLPEEVKSIGVTVGYSAFSASSTLEYIENSSSITAVGDYAFYGLANLKSEIDLSNVKTLGASTFYGCESLTGVKLSEELTTIPQYTFYGTKNITSTLYLPNVTTVGTQAWYEGSVGSVIFSDKLTSIGTYAFCACTNVKEVYLGNSLTSIPNYLFMECETVQKVNIPTACTKIGTSAFDSCWNLENMEIGDNVTSIGTYAFFECYKFTEFKVPTGVTSLGEGVLCECEGLTSVTLHDGIKSLGDYTFWGCVSLESVEIPASVTSIGEECFNACDSMKAFTVAAGSESFDTIDGVLFSKDLKTLVQYPIGLTATSYNVPEGTETIGSFAFCNQPTLETIVLPASLTGIGSFAFDACYALTNIEIDPANENLKIIDGLICKIEEGGYSIMTYTPSAELENFVIPDWCVSIGDYAFDGNEEIRSVVIPASVKTVGAYAFNNCTNIANVVMQPGLETIAKYAFFGCTSLSSISIPEGVTTIATYAFNSCTAVTTLSIPSTVSAFTSQTWGKCTAISNIYYMTDAPIKSGTGTVPSGIYKTCTVSFLTGGKEKAAALNYWKSFTSLQDIEGVVTLSTTALALEDGDEIRLGANAYGAAAKAGVTSAPETRAESATMTWTSSNEGVATVDADGTVRCVGAGMVSITAKSGDYSASCDITVADKVGGNDPVSVASLAADGENVDIYSISGAIVARGVDSAAVNALEEGLYIIRKGNKAVKVLVRK